MLCSMYSEEYVRKYRMLIPLMKKTVGKADGRRFITLAKSCLSCDIYEELDKITCPVFVIGGMKDKIVSPEASYEIAEKLKCEIYMYEDFGHAAYEEAKDFNKRIFEWLAK